MSAFHLLLAEFRKAVTLPGIWIGVGATLLGAVAITWLNSSQVASAIATGNLDRVADTSTFETAAAIFPLGTVGAAIIGVLIAGSEYTANSPDSGGGRQITTTLTAAPGRLRLVAAQIISVVLLVAVVAVTMLPTVWALAHWQIGEGGEETVTMAEGIARGAGSALYWVLMGIIAYAIGLLTRATTVPLLVLIVNSSMVSISFLLTKVTALAWWLPDIAGRSLFGFSADDVDLDHLLSPALGAAVMAAWTAGLLAVAVAVFSRRDA